MPPDARTPVIRRTNSVFPGTDPYPSPFGAGMGGGSGVPDQELRERIQHNLGFETDTEVDKAKAAEKRGEQKRTANRREQLIRDLQESEGLNTYVDGRRVQYVTMYDDKGDAHRVEVLGGYIQAPEFQNRIGVVGADEELGLPAVGLTTYQQGLQQNERKDRVDTFSVLGTSEFSAETRFLLGRGPQVDAYGQEVHSGNQDLRVGGRNASQNAPTTVNNMMTLAGGVTWFRSLAQTDKGLYNEMVDLLMGAGYLSEDAARHDVYTLDAGKALAWAGTELSENSKAGYDGDLRTFLQQVAQSRQDMTAATKGRDYQPGPRSYTDPEDLKATAREAARQILGRSLSDTELAAFTGRFRGLEDAMYDKVDAAGSSGAGGARVTDPNPGGQAEAMLMDPKYNTERARQLTGSYMDAFHSLIFGG